MQTAAFMLGARASTGGPFVARARMHEVLNAHAPRALR
eukprot:CAMPEP_0176309534 /NCGR_PEP_ID=MMETSP0121_2-20121125/65129_1 /TAXON_ID=160619 /ORGANISM="Kryptoperidinium foliaceum, Strain CCMP 1326" /LENGTH=37 /DNA_ID= /DNA_START= /DNA_END= /DNA_ORIENTATION=